MLVGENTVTAQEPLSSGPGIFLQMLDLSVQSGVCLDTLSPKEGPWIGLFPTKSPPKRGSNMVMILVFFNKMIFRGCFSHHLGPNL